MITKTIATLFTLFVINNVFSVESRNLKTYNVIKEHECLKLVDGVPDWSWAPMVCEQKGMKAFSYKVDDYLVVDAKELMKHAGYKNAYVMESKTEGKVNHKCLRFTDDGTSYHGFDCGYDQVICKNGCVPPSPPPPECPCEDKHLVMKRINVDFDVAPKSRKFVKYDCWGETDPSVNSGNKEYLPLSSGYAFRPADIADKSPILGVVNKSKGRVVTGEEHMWEFEVSNFDDTRSLTVWSFLYCTKLE